MPAVFDVPRDARTVLDAHQRQHPVHWWTKRAPPTALQIAVSTLEECRRDQLEQAQKAEYHGAMLQMLRDRDARLQQDIQRLSREQPDPLGGV